MQRTARPEQAQPTQADQQYLLTYPNLANPVGEVLLENDRVVVQRLVVGPGQWEGIHSHPGNQLCVQVKGGVWSGRLGGESSYSGWVCEDGTVDWLGDPIPLSRQHESGNTGDTAIELIWLTLKEDAPAAPDDDHTQQSYPNIPLELVLENDRVIVQRVQVEPGQWEGIHSHPGNQITIHIQGGVWSERRGGAPVGRAAIAKTGSVGWMDAVGLVEGHESGNTGDTTIDQVWVTLK